MNRRGAYVAILFALGAAWGFTMPIAKIAVSTGHAALGLVVWELTFAILLLFAISALRRRRLRFQRGHLRLYLLIATLGNLIPTTMWFFNARHLPAGILSIVISMVPMFALPIALMMGLEKFRLTRMVGILLGAMSIGLLIGPETSLPNPGKVPFVLLALIGPICYALEGNFVAKLGLGDQDSIQVLLGASLVALAVAAPITLATGSWVDLFRPWGRAEYALLLSSVLTTLAYAGYIWLVTRAGSVFSAQVSYLVTGFGVFWSIILLSESYSGWVWLSLGFMLAGLFLVRPLQSESLEPKAQAGNNAADS